MELPYESQQILHAQTPQESPKSMSSLVKGQNKTLWAAKICTVIFYEYFMMGLTKMIQIFADDHSNLYLNEIYKSFLSRNLSLNSKDITTTKNMERQINSRFKCWVHFIGSWARPAGNMVRGSIPEGEHKAHTHCNERKVHRKPWFVLSGIGSCTMQWK